MSATLTYPKETKDNALFRAKTISKADPELQTQAAIREICKKDILFWMNVFCWTYDPRPENYTRLGYSDAHIRFITWQFQDEYIKGLVSDIENEEDVVTEKSRDMGASWMILTVIQWFWQFGGAGNDFLIGSRKEGFVDRGGDMDALFPKIRYQLKRQPEWLLPKGFRMEKHTTHMKLINPETGSTITGESNNKFFGTGGRKKAVIFDEFSKWEHTDESAWQSASDVTNCKIAISSANGRNNHFYKLRAGQAGKINKHRLHWSLHPLKTQEWYEGEKARRSKQDLAAEVDIDYTASISNKAWESFEYQVHVTDEDLYNATLPIIMACDFNIEPMSWVFLHDINPMSVVFGELVNNERTRTEYHIQEFCQLYENHENKVVHIYGDATGKNAATSSIKSNYQIIKETLHKYGWSYQDYVPTGQPPVAERLDAGNKRLKDWKRDGESFVLIHESCTNFIDSLEQSRRKGDGVDKSDDVEHAAEAWSYYEVARYPIRDNKTRSFKLGGL